MKKAITFCTTLVAASLANTGIGATSQEIESRMESYEQQIRELQEQVKDLQPNSGKVQAKSIRRNEKRLKKLMDQLAEEKERFRLNGFLTGAASVSDEPLGGDYFFDDKVNFRGDSKAGIQFNYTISEKVDATVQMVARSRSADSWNLDAEWAFIGYKFTDSLKARVGRLRIPFYLYSESLDVGYAYPWVRPPVEMYTTLITAFDGADLTYKFRSGPINHSIQFWGGGFTNTNSDLDQRINLKDTYGINITSSWRDFTVRLSATQLKIEGDANVEQTLDTPIPLGFIPPNTTCASISAAGGNPLCNTIGFTTMVDDVFDYYAASFKYDNGTVFVITEGDVFRARDGFLFGDADSGYITGGMRFGNFTPYVTHGWTNTRNEDDFAGLPSGEPSKMKSWSLGTRYSLNAATSLTFEWNQFSDFEGTGIFSDEALEPGETDLDDANVYTLAIDTVF